MNRTFKAAVAVLIIAASFAGSVAAGPLQDANIAYEKGDYATALRLIRPLAEQGSADAQTTLGFMYANGQGVPQDYEAAVSWFRKAAGQGNAVAQLGLAARYTNGQGLPRDYEAAARWTRRVAERGFFEGQIALGFLYAAGRGVPQDYVLAHMWYNLAAVSGDKDAVKARDMVAARMTAQQIAEAQKLAREWKPK
jgi:uncharacterized protein